MHLEPLQDLHVALLLPSAEHQRPRQTYDEFSELLHACAPTQAQEDAAWRVFQRTHKNKNPWELLPSDVAMRKGGPGKVLLRDPSQGHHLVIDPEGKETRGLNGQV